MLPKENGGEIMISEEKLDEVLALSVEKEEIKKSELASHGITSYEVKEMIETGFLSRVRHGYYSVLDGAPFYQKALVLNRGRKFQDSIAYFKKSYDLGYEVSSCSFRLFLRFLENQDYEKSLSYLESLYHDESNQTVVSRSYNEMFFVLLANLVDSPMEKKDILQKSYVPIERKDNDVLTAKEIVRKAVLARQFDVAHRYLDSSFLHGPYRVDAQVVAMQQLILANQKQERIEEKQLTYYYQNGDYSSIVTLLSQKEEKCGLLSLEQSLMLKVAQKHVLLKEEQPLQKSSTEKTDPFSLIETNHFDKVSEYVESEFEDAVLLEDMLRDTIALQKKVNLLAPHKKPLPVKMESRVEVEKKIEVLPSEKLQEEEKEESTSVNGLLLLQQGEYQRGKEVISSLLQEKGKEKYQDIVMDSLRYSLLEEDTDFEELTKTFCTIIQEDKPTSLLPHYLVSFYQELGVDQAKCSLRLEQLKKLDEAGCSCDALPLLKKTFYFGGSLDQEALTRLEKVESKINQVEKTEKEKILEKK